MPRTAPILTASQAIALAARGSTWLAAVRAAVDDHRGPRHDDLVAHFDFAERRIDEGDPLKHPELLLPDVPDPKPDDLKPFLGGLSPHGPGSAGW